ncbi:MAG: CDP-alcohol phosphatidyltransferase family protein [Candidatus Obscuribacterales bacterium]|nr:CDP-alcohol phosphatidyltransferase family protein [Steroidobacteraceae bacterium]
MLRHLPNALCVLRMLLAIPVAVTLAAGNYRATLILFGFAAITDALDGYLAKRFNWTSELGKALDPLADKILLVAAVIALALLSHIPMWLAVAVVARDVIITAGAITYRVLYGPLTDARPTAISKINTLVQIAYVLCVVAALALNLDWPTWTVVLATLVIVTTVASGIDYVATYAQLAIRKSRERQVP